MTRWRMSPKWAERVAVVLLATSLVFLAMGRPAKAQEVERLSSKDFPFPAVGIDQEKTARAIGTPAGGSYSWESSNSSIIEIVSMSGDEAVLRGNSMGEADVRVTYTAPSGKTDTHRTTVTGLSKEYTAIGFFTKADVPLDSSTDNEELKASLNNAFSCLTRVTRWRRGEGLEILRDSSTPGGQLDLRFANSFLFHFSANNLLPNTIDTDEYVSRTTDYRQYNRLQIFQDPDSGDLVPFDIDGVTKNVVGVTPDPCGLVPDFMTALANPGEKHPDHNAIRQPPSPDESWRLNETRVGRFGQIVSERLNNRSIAWVWANLRIDSDGNLAMIKNPTQNSNNRLVDHSVFPRIFIYENGQKVDEIPNIDVHEFLLLDESYELRSAEIP